MFGKFGAYLATATGVAGIIVGLIIGGMLQGGPSAALSPNPSQSSTQSSSPKPTDEEIQPPSDDFGDLTPVNDPAFPEITYQFELDFFKLAIANCQTLKADGATLSMPDGSYSVVGLNKAGVLARIDYDASGAVVRSYVEQSEPICGPASVHEIATSKYADQTNSDHFHLDWMNEGAWVWHQHNGSAEMSTTHFTFKNGVLFDLSDVGFDGVSFATVEFGITAAQKAALKKVEF